MDLSGIGFKENMCKSYMMTIHGHTSTEFGNVYLLQIYLVEHNNYPQRENSHCDRMFPNCLSAILKALGHSCTDASK